MPTPNLTGDPAMPASNVTHVTYYAVVPRGGDCYPLGAYLSQREAIAVCDAELGADGYVATLRHRADGPDGWASEPIEGYDAAYIAISADGETVIWSVTAPCGERNEDSLQPLYLVTAGPSDLTVYEGPDHATSIAAAMREANR